MRESDQPHQPQPVTVAKIQDLYDNWQDEINVPGSADTTAFHELEEVIFEALPMLLARVAKVCPECEGRGEVPESSNPGDGPMACPSCSFPVTIYDNVTRKERVRIDAEVDDAFVLHVTSESVEPSDDSIEFVGTKIEFSAIKMEEWLYLPPNAARRLWDALGVYLEL